MTLNEGAVITGSRNLENLVSIKSIPYPTLEDDMVIIKTVAYAVNPTDWKHVYPEAFIGQQFSNLFRKFGLGFRPLESVLGSVGSSIGVFLGKGGTWYQKGNVSGSDVSGVVEAVGSQVKDIQKGDYVSGSLHGGVSKNAGFATYVMVSANSVVNFPKSQLLQNALETGDHKSDTINSFEAAASVGIGLKTIALSFHYNLGIPLEKSANKDDALLIWGGATATGILGIQIAKEIFGIKVLTTASKRNHEFLKSLGADEVFDYNDKNVIDQLKNAGHGKIKYALDCVSSPETLQCVYDATEGTEDVIIDNLLFLNDKSIITKPNRKVKFTGTDAYLVDGRRHLGHIASPEMLESYLEFFKYVLPSFTAQIKTAPLRVLPPGLESANEGLRSLIENKVACAKLVFRAKDV